MIARPVDCQTMMNTVLTRLLPSLVAPLSALLLAGCATAPPAPRTPSAQPEVSVLPPQRIESLGRERTLRLYLPPSYATSPQRRYPVIYMHDGQNLFDDATSYVGEWHVDETLNALARTHGFEAIVVGVDHGGERRLTELNPWPNPKFGAGEGEAYMRWIVEVLKPMVDRQYRTLPDAAHTAIVGSSMGGLISDYAIHQWPQVFGKAGVFSPAYWTAPPVFDFVRQHPLPAGARVYYYMGGAEGGDMVPLAERMAALTAAEAPAGVASTLHLVPGAPHNEGAWSKELPTALAWLFELKAQ
jgi:predicted alpha/beta superfamily hydrolase